MISIVVITFNRLKLLKQCVNNVLFKTSQATKEIIIWNNGSIDGTKDYLTTIKDPRIRVVNHTQNIGTNARPAAFKLTKFDYLISLDDDVIDAPEKWDQTLLRAFRRLPQIGFLAAHIIDDGKGTHAHYMFREKKLHSIQPTTINGIDLILGYAGAWCSITSRALYDEAGGFQENPRFIFGGEDTKLISSLKKKGYSNAILTDLKVFHAAGPFYLNDKNIQRAKSDYYRFRRKQQKIRRYKTTIKKLLDKTPPIRLLNAKYRFYSLPEDN